MPHGCCATDFQSMQQVYLFCYRTLSKFACFSVVVSFRAVVTQLQSQCRCRHQLCGDEVKPGEEVCSRGSYITVNAAPDPVGGWPCPLSGHTTTGNTAQWRHVCRGRLTAWFPRPGDRPWTVGRCTYLGLDQQRVFADVLVNRQRLRCSTTTVPADHTYLARVSRVYQSWVWGVNCWWVLLHVCTGQSISIIAFYSSSHTFHRLLKTLLFRTGLKFPLVAHTSASD